MRIILEIIESGDVCSSLFLLLILFFVGAKTIEHFPQLFPCGRYAALAAFLLYVAFRSMTAPPDNADDLAGHCLRGLLAAGFACSVCWIALPVAVVLWSSVFGSIMRFIQHGYKRAKCHLTGRKAAKLREQHRLAADREWERSAPHREHERAEAAARAATEAQVAAVRAQEAATEQKRRDESRMRVELLYERHARQLTVSLPRERFAQFLDQYMNDGLSPDAVEQREQLLKEMLVESLGTTHTPVPKFATMTDLAAFFEARRQEIQNLPHNDEVKDSYRTQLNRQEDEALRRFLRP